MSFSSTIPVQMEEPPRVEDIIMGDIAATLEPPVDPDSNMLEAGGAFDEENSDGDIDYIGDGAFDEEECRRDSNEDGSSSSSSDCDSTLDEHQSSTDDEAIGETEPAILIDGPGISGTPRNPATSNATQRDIPQHRTEPLENFEDIHTETYPAAGRVFAQSEDFFTDELRAIREEGKGNIYYPFANDVDFELAAWLGSSGLSRSKIDEFLRLKYVSFSYAAIFSLTFSKVQDRMPSFKSASSLLASIELLPEAGPRWKQREVVPEHGEAMEPAILFYKDPVEAVAHLLSRPSLAPYLDFAPRRVWTNNSKDERVYSEMCTGNWWWEVQVSTFD